MVAYTLPGSKHRIRIAPLPIMIDCLPSVETPNCLVGLPKRRCSGALTVKLSSSELADGSLQIALRCPGSCGVADPMS
jgi:hypothetical protein